MSIKRHLFPFVGALVIIADIPPLPGPKPGPGQPSTPGCTMRRSSGVTNAQMEQWRRDKV
ncbi:MAG: hypothetical protein ACO1TE_26285 [Prosthecobacter sp.]